MIIIKKTIFLVYGLLIISCVSQHKTDSIKKVNVVNKKSIRAVGVTLKTSFAFGKQEKEVPPFFHKTFESKILE